MCYTFSHCVFLMSLRSTPHICNFVYASAFFKTVNCTSEKYVNLHKKLLLHKTAQIYIGGNWCSVVAYCFVVFSIWAGAVVK